MATDNSPIDYIYISRRLVRQIVDQHSAARRWRFLRKLGVRVSAAGLSAEITAGAADTGNLFELTQTATEAITDNTGDLASPGLYIRATLDMTWDAIPVHMGWDDAANVPIASFFADAKVEDVGGVFLGLFGSASNFLGRGSVDYQSGWMPSDAVGLYRILEHTSEPGDPKVSRKFINDDRHNEVRYLVGHAVTLFKTARPLSGSGRVEVLAKCFYTEQNIDVSWPGFLRNGVNNRYGLAVLGAPIWVRDPSPRPDPHFANRTTALPRAGGPS